MRTILEIVLIIAVVMATIFIKNKFFSTKVTETVTIFKTDTIKDTTKIVKRLPAPEPDTIIKVDTVIIPDSSDIFEQYAMLYQKHHRQNIYNPVLKDDTSAYMNLHFIVSQNKIQDSIDFTFKNRRPTVVNKTINKTIVNQRKLFIGSEFGVNSIQPSIMFKSKNDNIYKVGYDMIKPRGVRIGFYTSIQNIAN